MRDKNLTLTQFHMQLEKTIVRRLSDDWNLRRRVSTTPTCQFILSDLVILYPRDYRLLRTLCIIQWYLPEFLHWRIYLDLKEKTFSQLNEKQKLELSIFLDSKEIMEFYLFETKRYSGSEIFGNILGNDLRDLQKTLIFRDKFFTRPKRKTRHRGYRDHGSRIPDHKKPSNTWISETALQLKKEQKLKLHIEILNRILLILRERLKNEMSSN